MSRGASLSDVGDTTATIEATRRKSVIRQCATLRWHDDAWREQRVETGVVVGSSEDAQVVVRAPTVSRMHCLIEPRADGIWVRDLGSRNGTLVGNVLVREGRLPPAARLRLGDVEIEVVQHREGVEQPLWPTSQWGHLVGETDAMRLLFMQLARVARSDSTVLITGATGTGKEMAARSIHEASERAESPFVVFDCAAVPRNLMEAELFGYARGAFTGARDARPGLARMADGGTLLLDEIGELPLDLQPKLLRFLEQRTVRGVGETDEQPVDLRVLAATHRDLPSLVREGTFREDLYYRLAVIEVRMPSLHERAEDVPLLVRRLAPEGLSPSEREAIVEAARERAFPGNVRELAAFVNRVSLLGLEHADGPSIAYEAPTQTPAIDSQVPFKELRASHLDHLERSYLSALIEERGRSLSALARASGLDRSYVYRLLKKHGL